MTTGLVAVVALGVICCGLYWLKQRGSEQTRQLKHETRRFAGVAIFAEESASACNAMRAIEGKRFLSHDAPIIPLAECDAQQCSCRYVRYDDRRDGEDRRALVDSGGASNMDERRVGSGRRESDEE